MVWYHSHSNAVSARAEKCPILHAVQLYHWPGDLKQLLMINIGSWLACKSMHTEPSAALQLNRCTHEYVQTDVMQMLNGTGARPGSWA